MLLFHLTNVLPNKTRFSDERMTLLESWGNRVFCCAVIRSRSRSSWSPECRRRSTRCVSTGARQGGWRRSSRTAFSPSPRIPERFPAA
ncbi:MAG: hypothetical protein L6W00_17285 [Lentisphaeria bacterium]|nr:MAG: hypothetical protein L6W00_17285 [Lentisphaeria bacterium]